MKILFAPDEFFTGMALISKIAGDDGHGSGLDADLLDGQHGSYYLPASSYNAADILSKLLNVDGAGSGLDADKIDGVQLAQILAQGTDIPGSANLNNYTVTGLYHQNTIANAESGSNYPVALAGMLEVVQDGSMIYQKYTVYNSAHNVYVRTYYSGTWYSWYRLLDQNDLTTLNNNIALKLNASTYTAADILTKLKTVDGPSSGLDADLLDGVQYSAIESAINAKLNASTYTAADILSKLLTVDGPSSGLNADLLDGQHGSYYLPASSYTATDILTKLKTVDGSGSGLDADLLDGAQPSSTGGTANAIVKTRANGTIDNEYLPFSEDEGTFPILKRVSRETISEGSPVTYVNFTGLNGNSDKEYILKYNIFVNQTVSAGFNIEFNGDTGSNYHSDLRRFLDSNGTITPAEGSNSVTLLVGRTAWDYDNRLNGKASILAQSGAPRSVRGDFSFYRNMSYNGFGEFSGWWSNDSDNITSLKFENSQNNTFYGTVELLKLVELVIG